MSSEVFGGPPAQVVDAARNEKFIAILSLYILREFRAVAQAKFGILPEEASSLIEMFVRTADVLPVLEASRDWCDDRADDAVVETAIRGQADYLVTGDRRLLEADVPGIEVVTVARFLEVLGDRDT